ncbi:serine/threonine-protein kinase [Parahaliea aestuarii]|uniref:Serine/threonine protein kinase n=1 Tax=Parahaliea aestuarii TaxID=1852021 RepID=A0A5C8ZZ64_9GAMM|nr:serine/threonine-protein kinase [Parahaliea aestuarii]TXS92521.1 serine/threonine protein kinase [Parahaliea aestuarii]
MPEFQQQVHAETPLYAEEMDAPLPETLNPNTRYAYFSTIATGGKSLIKSCRDLHLRRTICYKTLRPEFVRDPIENRRLVREARISAALQHPNTLPTYELGRDNRGNYYFTMKLVHGYTLREILNYRERYDLTQLMEVLEQVAQALGYAHSMGVLHRDVKPDNILVGPYGEVLLMDWGLAKVWHKADTRDDDEDHEEAAGDPGMTGEAKLQGTVMYMSPEQINRDPAISFGSDIYSLGCLLYETLTGTTPFQGDVVYKLLDQIRNELPPDPRSVSKFPVPDALADLAMQCLQKDPEARPGTADTLVRVLKSGWLHD